jgi:hypothetical protein
MLIKTGDAEILEVVETDEEEQSKQEKGKVLANALEQAKEIIKSKTQDIKDS